MNAVNAAAEANRAEAYAAYAAYTAAAAAVESAVDAYFDLPRHPDYRVVREAEEAILVAYRALRAAS